MHNVLFVSCGYYYDMSDDIVFWPSVLCDDNDNGDNIMKLYTYYTLCM